MDEREKILWRIVRAAQDVEPDARAAFLDARCGDDAALRHDVTAMLARIERRESEVADAPARVEKEPASDANDSSETDALLGARLGSFRLVERIGRGGMGVVYRGTREGADFAQDVAVKLIRRGFDFDDVHARFLRERRILARLDHPNLARFIDGGVAPDGRPWFALEYVRGEPITRWCDQHRRGLRARIHLFLDICAAVQHAHAQLVVHRDLKPANILVDGGARVHLLDFGIARLVGGDDDDVPTAVGQRYALTPEYAAPEQFSGGIAGVATDVYALGVILYELVAGVLPLAIERGDLLATAHLVRTAPPAALSGAIFRDAPGGASTTERLAARATTARAYRREVRGDLSRIVDKTLAKDPVRRYPTVDALADDLSRWLAGAPVRASGDGLGYRLGKFVRRHRVPVAIAAVAIAAIVAGVAGTLWQAHRANVAATAARADAASAAAARDFLASLLGKASPELDGRPETTVREVLDHARSRIASEFASQPALRTEMSTLIGHTYNDLGEYGEGLALLRESAKLADADSRVPAGTRGAAHAELAYALLARNDAAEAEHEATTAITLLRREPSSDALANALGTLATALYLQERFAPALEAQRESIDVTGDLHGADSEEHAAAQMELSYFLAAGSAPADAIPVAQDALRALDRRYPGIDKPVVTRALWALGNALSSADRDAEAVPYLQRARDMVGRIYGYDGAKFMRSLQLLGVAELSSGDLPAARKDLALAAHLVETSAPDHPLVSIIHMYYAISLLRAGDAELALTQALRAAKEAAKAGRNDVADRAAIVLARARSLLGRDAEAIAALDESLPGMRERHSDKLALALAAKAGAQRRHGDVAGAVATMREAIASAGSLQRGGQIELLLEQARVALASGDAKTAAEHAHAAKQLLTAAKAERAPEFAEAERLETAR